VLVDTVTVEGVPADVCETESQPPPEVVDAAAMKFMEPLILGAVICIVAGAGFAPETAPVNAMLGAFVTSTGGAVTDKVTGMEMAPLALATPCP
jgi:hypothetical protein